MEISETISSKPTSTLKKIIFTFLKVLVTLFCLWYVSKKIDFKEAAATLKGSDKFYLLGGLTLYFLSKIVAAARLNIYFKNINIRLSQLANFKLYLLGLFYNLFLPGSIGGDAYKVVVLKKKLAAPYRKTSIAVLLDRFSGLLGLGLVLCIYGFVVIENKSYAVALVTGLMIGIVASYVSIKKWFPEFLPGFWSTFFLGLLVQLFANLSAYLIILSLGITTHLNQYMFIFLVASIAAVLPLTLGGLGAREIVFYQLSTYFHLNIHSSVLIGLLFYLMVVVTSATGLLYIFKDPLKKLHKNQ